MEEVVIFANPIAGSGRGRGIAERLAGRLGREGYAVRLYFERAERLDAAELTARRRPPAAVIVVGGDGTLRTVARTLLQRYAPAESPPLLLVPLGTANLMGRHLGIRLRGEDFDDRLVATLKQCRILRLDAASANGELFLLVAGVGIDGHIVHELDRIRSGPIGFTSYALPALKALAQFEYPPLTVSIEGREVVKNVPAMAFVGNIAEYGTGFPLLPFARPDDGALDVCVMPCASRREALSLFLHAAAGEHLRGEGVVYAKAKHVTIESPRPVPVQIDGEPAGQTPLSIDLLPVRIPFIVP